MLSFKQSALKKVVAAFLLLATLIPLFIVNVSAKDSVFLETLIDTDKYVYVPNFVIDETARGNRYAYKYLNMAYVMGNACGNDDINVDSAKDPNKCFRLNGTNSSGNYDYKWYVGTADDTGMGTSKNIDLYFLMEGYVISKDVGDGKYEYEPITDDTNRANAIKAKEKNIYQKKKKQTMPLAFPGYWDEAVTTDQTEYAQQLHSELVSSLNAILLTINDGKKFTSVADLVNKSIMIRPEDDKNIVYIEPIDQPQGKTDYTGYVLMYADLTTVTTQTTLKEMSSGDAAKRLDELSKTKVKIDNAINVSSAEFLNTHKLPRASKDGALYCYVFPVKTETDGAYIDFAKATFCAYAIPKGYIDIKYGNDNDQTFYKAQFLDSDGKPYEYTEDPGEVPWISIHMLSMYANSVYKWEGMSTGTYVGEDPDFISNLIGSIFERILGAIKGILQLEDLDTLVFNLGARGTASYNYGLMSENWWHVVLQYQLIFQAIAWVVLIVGFIKTLISMNLSTINPQKRMSLYDTIQKFIVVGIALVIMIPVIQFMLECNDTIVELFASQIDTSSLNMPTVSNVIVQVIIGFLWLTIMLYINFIYIMRSITVAILIASGPFFISTMAFSHGGSSSLFVSWAKELIANIFVQSMHAFILSFLLQLMSNGKVIETFAIAISIIPLTEMFRNLIFAGAGGSTSQMAQGAANFTQKGLQGLRQGTTNTAVSLVAGMGESSKTPGEADRDKGNGGGGGGGRGGGGSAGGVRDLVNKKNATRIDRIANAVHSDKTKGKKFWSVVGNSAVIIGNEAAAGLANVADIGDALQTFALTGDANGIQGAMATAGGGAVSGVVGTIQQGVQSHRDIKARQGSTTEQNKVKPTDKSLGKLKQQTGQKEGQSATGANLMASMKENHVEQDLYESPKTDTISYSNANDSKDSQNASNAISAFKQSNNGTVKSAIMKDNNGQNIKGNLYQFKNSNGKNTSFFVSDSVAEKAKNIDPKEQRVSDGEIRKVGQQISAVSSSNVQSELVRSKGNVANVVDANGNKDDKHEYRTYAGRIYQIPKTENSKAKEKVQKLLNHAQNGTGNVNMTQTEESFANEMSKDNGQPIACNDNGSFDLSVNDSSDTGAYTNAAMVTALGTKVKEKENTYKLGGKEFYTGMSKSDATAIAKGVGITKMSNHDGIISYRQGAPAIGSTPTEVRHLNGKTIAQYDIGIGSGKGYAPTDFVATDRGGGTLTFPSPKAAEMFMRTNGNIAMAEAIHGVERGKDLDFGLGFINLSNDGKLNIKYSETSLAACGIKIERAAGDHQKLMVSSSNGEVVNPFFASGEITEKTNNGGYISESD